MSNTFVFLAMIFLHILDDFHLQGILAEMKQKKWWRTHPQYKPMYKNDYLVALVIHCLSWAFMIMLPIAFVRGFDVGTGFVLICLTQAVIHGIIDDLKANLFKINLIADQVLHLVQIVIVFAFYTGGVI